MFLRFADRPSDSPYIERVWRARSDGGGPFLSVAAGHLELVVTRLADSAMVTVRGPETRATTIDCPPDGEWAAIRFRLGLHMPSLPTGLLLDHRDLHLPVSADGTFELHGFRWPLPDLENAERYVDQLARRGVIARDHVVEAAIRGSRTSTHHPFGPASLPAHDRLTHGQFRQIERARYATNLLRDGASILDTVHEAGYFDQAHLTRSLKVLIGETPASSRGGTAAVVSVQNTPTSAGLICRQSFLSGRRVVRVEPYVYFQGRCEEALAFYRGAIGADATVFARFDDKVAHAVLRIGDTVVLASDGQGAGQPDFSGFSLSLTVSDDAEAERLFDALSDGGRVQVPMAPTPFASRLGLVADKFGVPWMVVSQNATG